MEANGKVGTVKMKPFYALKRVCEEYSMDTVIGGGILKRFQAISNKAIKDKTQNKQQGKEQNIMIIQCLELKYYKKWEYKENNLVNM